MTRGEQRGFEEAARVLGIVTEPVLVLLNRRATCGEGDGVEDGLRRVKARAKVRGVAMAVVECGESRAVVREGRRRKIEIRRRRDEWWGLPLSR